MASAADLGVDRCELVPAGRGTGSLADGFGERHQIIHAARRRPELAVMPDDLPAPRGGQADRMLLAKVVGVGFGKRRQRSDNGGRIRIYIGQRCDRQTWAAVARATPW